MRRRIKSRRTRAVIKRPRRGSVVENHPTPVKEEHKSDAVPPILEQIIRKPLNTAHISRTRKSRRKNKAQRNQLLSLFAQRLQASNHWNGKLIRPHAVLNWLEKTEPYSAEYLLENAESISYEDGDDKSDPVFSAELDSIINKFSVSKIDNSSTAQDSFEIPKDYSMILTPFAASGHADHEAMMVFEDQKQNFIERLQSGRRVSKALSETDDEDEEMIDALTKQIRNSQSQQNMLDTVIEEDSDTSEDAIQSTKQHSGAAKVQRGFDAVQVLKKHAISFENINMPHICNLTSPIHPIFREENFHDCPQYIYDVLKPGLQLCTLLLTHRATACFWLTLCNGERTTTANHNVKRIIKDVTWSKALADQYASQLLRFARSLHFHFGLFPTPKHTMEYSYASMHPIKDHLVGWQPKPGEPCRRSRIRLHTDFYTTARKLSKLRNPDHAQVLRFNFFFAVNLAHEMAHFLWMSNWNTKRLDIYSFDTEVLAVDAEPEPYFNDQAFNELGAAFETKIFGGRIEPISCRVDCAYGLTTSDQPNTTDPHPTRTFYTIPMDYIAKIQQQSTWEQVQEDACDPKVFHIPRNGAESISVPYFDMTIWRDEATDGKVSDIGLKKQTPFKRMDTGIIRADELEKTA
ncbi:uncharacterized protein PV09_02584 [Verruconis gallopava]|uniref:Uncharacterized protein n=1 Tax=Verruconis gallopava TaxID=253628 RepID=A0A0D2AK28_9PEZI|nr:uncharacterized protein PV09_02584 [Verruconis gallopava]KIW06915.1 hypothetical protein PV09_02584 [Verruconis gallopava]